jgi:hypothetical protein
MTRQTKITEAMTVAFVLAFCAHAGAAPQPMQTMTTVGGPQPVQLAQANTTSDSAPSNLAPASNAAPRVVSSQPAQLPGDQEYVFVVNEVEGKVWIAPIGTDALGIDGAKWVPLRVGDRIGRGSVVRSDFKAKAKLVGVPADPPTVMLIESGTVLAFEEMVVRNNRQQVRMSLGVGAVKAGVAESGDVRSDMEIRMPTGTLSKKGTDIFRLEYQNGRFHISLSEQGRGLLQAINLKFGSSGNLITSRSRFVTRGQFVTQEMFKAIDHVKFDREININDLVGQTPNELLTLLNNRGIAFILPFGDDATNFLGLPGFQRTGGDMGGMNGLTGTPIGSVRRRGEGDFGVGQTVLPGTTLFGANNRKIGESRQITNREGKRLHRRTDSRRIRNR